MSKELFAKGQVSVATYVPAILLLASAWAILVYAFFQPKLGSEQRDLGNYFAAIVSWSVGYLGGGVVLNITGWLSPSFPRLRFALKALSGAALFVLTLYHPIFPSSPTSSNSADGKPLMITSPPAGGTVGPTAIVRGQTSHPRLNHYLIIEGPQGGAAIQDDPLMVSSTGELSGQGVFGSSAVGAGEVYRITLVATKKNLQPGPYSPSGGEVYSNPVIVTRESSKETETRR